MIFGFDMALDFSSILTDAASSAPSSSKAKSKAQAHKRPLPAGYKDPNEVMKRVAQKRLQKRLNDFRKLVQERLEELLEDENKFSCVFSYEEDQQKRHIIYDECAELDLIHRKDGDEKSKAIFIYKKGHEPSDIDEHQMTAEELEKLQAEQRRLQSTSKKKKTKPQEVFRSSSGTAFKRFEKEKRTTSQIQEDMLKKRKLATSQHATVPQGGDKPKIKRIARKGKRKAPAQEGSAVVATATVVKPEE